MIELDKYWGRLSNEMFIFAHHYAYTQRTGTHFFVQDEKYFAGYKDEIKKMFSVGINPNSMPFVAIHRRLGDYKGNTFYVDLGHHEHQNLEENYFVRAMAEFPPDKQFMVFSDEIELAKKEPMFQGDNFHFSEGKSAVQDMNLMASCQGIIGSNSSYSWWSAYLSGAEKIIFPAKWFTAEENNQFIGLLPTWKRI